MEATTEIRWWTARGGGRHKNKEEGRRAEGGGRSVVTKSITNVDSQMPRFGGIILVHSRLITHVSQSPDSSGQRCLL